MPLLRHDVRDRYILIETTGEWIDAYSVDRKQESDNFYVLVVVGIVGVQLPVLTQSVVQGLI